MTHKSVSFPSSAFDEIFFLEPNQFSKELFLNVRIDGQLTFTSFARNGHFGGERRLKVQAITFLIEMSFIGGLNLLLLLPAPPTIFLGRKTFF